MQKVLFSDEVNQKVLTDRPGIVQDDPDCDYPFVVLEDGKRFYFNRFLFL